MTSFSLLMSIYEKEKVEYLRECLESIATQTILPTEIILVEDGPLTYELKSEISKAKKNFPNLRTIPLEHNCGLGKALNVGMEHCQYDIIARMDTDDICVSNRFEMQLAFLREHPEIDVVGSWIDEFVGSTNNIVSTRRVPETNKDIFEFGKRRNPMNHPTVMFRKQAVEKAGLYQPFPMFEDYYLWVRMLQNGYKFHNIQHSLLLFRRSADLFKRRGGFSYIPKEIRFQIVLCKRKYISSWIMLKNIAIRSCVRIFPNKLRDLFYLKCLRN